MSSSSNRQKPAMAQHARAAPHGKRKRSLGVTLIEAIAAIGVMSAATVGLVALVDGAMDNTRAHATAQHMSAIGQSASIYVRDNFASIAAIATPTHAALVRVSDMVTTGHLSANFSPINPRGQSVCIAVLEPEPNRLLGLVVAQGGETIDDVTLGHIAATIGGSGGAVYAATPSEIRGAMGGWSLPLSTFSVTNHLSQACNGAAGTAVPQVGRPVKALWFVDGAANAALMRDAIPGNPAMNTMNTPILMGTGTVATLGDTCPTPGAVARTSDGLALSCFGVVWQSSDTCRGINAGTDLNGLTIPAGTQSCVNGHGLGNAPTADWFFVEIIRHVNTLNHYATQRATGMTGAASGRVWTRSQHGGAWTAWRAVGVDHLGNLTVPGTATIERLAGTLEVTRVVTANTACWPNGSLARDTAGALLSCQGGTWRSATGGGGQWGYVEFATPFLRSIWRTNTSNDLWYIVASTTHSYHCHILAYVNGNRKAEQMGTAPHFPDTSRCSISIALPPGVTVEIRTRQWAVLNIVGQGGAPPPGCPIVNSSSCGAYGSAPLNGVCTQGAWDSRMVSGGVWTTCTMPPPPPVWGGKT